MTQPRKSCLTCRWSGWLHPPSNCMACWGFSNWVLKPVYEKVPPKPEKIKREKDD